MSELAEAVYKEIVRITKAKREAKTPPYVALKKELDVSVRDALNTLYKEGRIHAGETINDKYIRIKDGKEKDDK